MFRRIGFGYFASGNMLTYIDWENGEFLKENPFEKVQL